MIAALFDLDGVLIDTEGIYSGFWAETGRAFGIEDPLFAQKIKGTTLAQILNNNFSPEQRPQVYDRLIEFENKMVYRVYPGVIEFLNQLRSHDIPAAIVTSSGEKKMEKLWLQQPALRTYFQAIITDADVTHSKPHPEPYLIAAKKLNCPIQDCYVFEDSINGIISGHNAGAKVIALTTTNPREALVPDSNLIIDSFVGFNLRDMLEIQ